MKLRLNTEPEAEALEQIARSLDRAGLAEAWLVLLDLRKDLPWADKLFARDAAHAGKTSHVIGC